MTKKLRRFSLVGGVLVVLLGASRAALAANADAGADATVDAGADAFAPGDAAPGDAAVDGADGAAAPEEDDNGPWACDKALCDTTTGGTPCSIAGLDKSSRPLPLSGAVVIAAVGLAALTRRRAKEHGR